MIDNRWMDKRLKEVLMIDELSIVETNKVNHTVETDMVKLVIEIKCFGMIFDEFDKETGSSDGMQPKQADLSCVHALNEPHLHEIRVVPSKHEADQYTREQSGQPVMTREEEDGIFVALDPQTLSFGFCVSTEWEVVFLGGTTLSEVILVKGHKLPTMVKVLPVGFHLNPTLVNT
ncbi:hypothetical protein Tco_0493366 [Tanacetum coccineum]